MYLMQNIAVLTLLLHQFNVNGFNIFDIGNGFNYLNKEISSMVSASLQDENIKTLWIIQELDHFDSENIHKWRMRYFENLKHWKENGPIYVFVGGEGTSSPDWTRSGIMYELAKETHGAMFVTEHRYYGKSKPLHITNATKFKYLSSRQALADIAKLIHTVKSVSLYKNSKVVVIGGSYAGNLAAWMKVLYPDLIDAAIASSAPVLAKKDFYEYLEKVSDNYENYGTEGCLDVIKEIFEEYTSLLQSPEGIEKLKKDENICGPCDMGVLENQQLFFDYKINPFMTSSQYGTPKDINTHCGKFNNTNQYYSFLKDKPFHRFIYSERQQCYTFDFNEMIKELQYSEDNYVAWLYQTCTEFGYYQTTSSKNQVFFNLPLQFYIKMCTGIFGNDFDEKRVDTEVERTNNLFSGLKPNVTKVVFTNGDMDPWSTLGVLEDLSYDAPAVVIPRSSHCRDLFSDKENDIEELKEARKHIKYLIKRWIEIGEHFD